MKATKLAGFDDNQEGARLHRRRHKPAEEHLILSVPYARAIALEYSAGHAIRVIGVESPRAVEPYMAGDLAVTDDPSVHHNSSSVKVRRTREPTGIGCVTAHAPAPHASESGHTHEHVIHL